MVEITEIQEPGRKRDEEHKTLGVLSAAYVPEEQVETRTEAIVKAPLPSAPKGGFFLVKRASKRPQRLVVSR